MNKKQLSLTFLLILLCLTSLSLWLTSSDLVETVHEDLADNILRFHVLANSDSEEDQALKLKVKNAVLDYMKKGLSEDADLEDTKEFIKVNATDIKTLAESIISEEGYTYPVSLSLEPWYFPTKSYGDLTFPCGTYEAFRIVIGDGDGKNWWCVLYPSLCFVDVSYGIVPEDSKETLKNTLDEDTYASLLSSEKPQFSFKLWEILTSLF